MKLQYRITVWILLLALFCALIPVTGSMEAAETRYGMVTNANTLKVRSGVGTSNPQTSRLVGGAIVEILSEAKASDGKTWYEVKYGEIQGFVHGGYITECSYPVTEKDEAFEAKLAAENFPESYKERLRIVHALYPNWEFKSLQTGLTWQEAIAGEMVEGRSLVSGSEPSSWKSTEGDAYDWTTSTWKTGWDSGDWVLASEEVLSHYMDPRNFLTTEGMFLFLDQSFSETQTVEGVRTIAEGTFLESPGVELDGTEIDYAQVIYNAGKSEGVNPYVLASMIIQEMGTKGTSNSICGTYEGVEGSYKGYYNYYNIAAYKTARFSSAIEHGLWYAKGGDNGSTTYKRPWNSRKKAIIGGANFYAQGYISVGQDTLYLKKYNVQGTNLYKHQYMTNVDGAFGEACSLSDGYSESARKEALIFEIPVYANMPEKPCPIPFGDGSPNNKLSDISVKGYDLTPDFDMDTNEYDLVVGNGVASVEITAAAYDKTATIQGTGTHNLTVGDNTIILTVTAENGDIREYTLTIARQVADGEAPNVTGTSLTITGQQVYGVTPGTTAESALKGVTVENGSVAVVNSKNAQKEAGETVGTGDSLVIYDANGGEYARYTVVIRGDVSGDGKITTSDLVKVRNHLLETNLLSGPYSEAADINKDSKLVTGDLVKIRNHLLETAYIEQ
ncbi:MAG: cadherin-like beta sandwich domain-containing protein [Clostridia bacterium]|nr:cadherin-like beta sandwich domain-containing protein [Clostridia bacterium]